MYLPRRNVKSVSELYLPSCMRHTSVCRPEGEPAAAIADRQRLLISCHHWKENTARRLEQPGIRFWMKLLEEGAQYNPKWHGELPEATPELQDLIAMVVKAPWSDINPLYARVQYLLYMHAMLRITAHMHARS